MSKKNINILKYFHNKFKNNRGIKRIIFILSITMVVPLVFGLSFLALRSNNDIVSESVKHYRKSQTDIIKAELYPEIAPNTVNNFIYLINKGLKFKKLAFGSLSHFMPIETPSILTRKNFPLIVHSEELKNHCIKEFQIPSSNITVIPNSVLKEYFKNKDIQKELIANGKKLLDAGDKSFI